MPRHRRPEGPLLGLPTTVKEQPRGQTSGFEFQLPTQSLKDLWPVPSPCGP